MCREIGRFLYNKSDVPSHGKSRNGKTDAGEGDRGDPNQLGL